MKRKVVTDASVILSYILEENPGMIKRFEKLLNDVREEKVEILSHHLVSLEVANGLRFKLTKDGNLAREIFKTFLQLPFKLVPLTKVQQEKALSLSLEIGTTVYDTSYHILAKSHGATFLTADREYFKKAKILDDIELWE